jgi:transposase-like protein
LGFRSIGRYLKVSHVSVQNRIKIFDHELEKLKSENEIAIAELEEKYQPNLSDQKNI